jgi:hypothetical protein
MRLLGAGALLGGLRLLGGESCYLSLLRFERGMSPHHGERGGRPGLNEIQLLHGPLRVGEVLRRWLPSYGESSTGTKVPLT